MLLNKISQNLKVTLVINWKSESMSGKINCKEGTLSSFPGAKFIPPSNSEEEEEVTEESENSSEKDCGSESNKDEKATSYGDKLQTTTSNSSRYSNDEGKSTNSSTNENAVEHQILKVPKTSRRETSQDRASRTLTRDKELV